MGEFINRPVNTRPIKGHRLMHEGAPHDENGERLNPLGARWGPSASGEGRAKCECGAMSEVLPSRNKRAQWHRDHKMDVKTKES